MRWFWSDELAEALRVHEPVSPEQIAGWIERPVAYSAPDDATALELALLVLQRSREDPAA